MKTEYYYLKDIDIVAKETDYVPYVYIDSKWIVDNDNLLNDRLVDYGDCSIMDVDEITKEEALRLIERDVKKGN